MTWFGCNAGPAEGEEEGEQAISSREESQVDDPIELLNRMSGNSDRLQDCAKPITPTFEHDGYLVRTNIIFNPAFAIR